MQIDNNNTNIGWLACDISNNNDVRDVPFTMNTYFFFKELSAFQYILFSFHYKMCSSGQVRKSMNFETHGASYNMFSTLN